MDTTLATVTPLLDKYFTKSIAEVVYDPKDADPWLSYLELEGENEAGGNDGTIVVRIIDDGDIIVSPDLETAGGSIGTYRFECPLSKLEWKCRIRRDAIDATKGNPVGVFDIAKKSIAAHVRQALLKLAKHSMTKRGALGVIKSKLGQTLTIGGLESATGSTTNDDPTLANRFRDGMVLVSSDALDSGNLAGSSPGDSITIDAGGIAEGNTTLVLTCTGTMTNFAAGNYLFEKGDSYYARGTRRTIVGALEWCDFAAPGGSEDFLGKNRSLYPNLQAMRFDATDLGWKESLMRARSRFITKNRKAPTFCGVNQRAYDEIEAETDAQTHVQVTLEKAGPGGKVITIGLTGIRLTNGKGGTIDVVALPFIEYGLFIMGPHKDAPFKLAYTDQLVRFDKMAGMWRLEEVSDGTEKHVTYTCQGSVRGAIYCTNPSAWLTGSNHFGPPA